jgi:DNA invertase Pin-like site-specific DNA recombinase
MKALGYVRVSTDRQGISLEAQAEKIKAMALLFADSLSLSVRGESPTGKRPP